jgi:hypothetical protein
VVLPLRRRLVPRVHRRHSPRPRNQVHLCLPACHHRRQRRPRLAQVAVVARQEIATVILSALPMAIAVQTMKSCALRKSQVQSRPYCQHMSLRLSRRQLQHWRRDPRLLCQPLCPLKHHFLSRTTRACSSELVQHWSSTMRHVSTCVRVMSWSSHHVIRAMKMRIQFCDSFTETLRWRGAMTTVVYDHV